MKSRLARQASVFLLLLILAVGFAGIAVQKDAIHKDVSQHLLERGYKNSDILSISSYRANLGSGVEKYHAKVYFTDEPEGDYHYSKDAKTGEIRQGDYYGSGKHKE